jgi:hypothetical protein
LLVPMALKRLSRVTAKKKKLTTAAAAAGLWGGVYGN